MTQDEIIDMAMKAEFVSNGKPSDEESELFICLEKDIYEFAKLVAAKEREACAEICDSFYLSWIDVQGRYEFMGEGASECAGAIRARGQA